MLNRFSLLVVLIISSSTTNSQKLKSDSLVNYSYMISGGNNGEYFDNGTGFIINYKEKFFLVSNFHVITAKDPLTGKKMPDLKDTNTFIAIVFRPIHDNRIFNPFEYKLFNKDGSKNFYIFLVPDVCLLDIAVLPIEIPNGVIKHFFTISDIDRTTKSVTGTKLDIVGFQLGQFVNKWQPAEIYCKSLQNTIVDPCVGDAYLYFDTPGMKGMSGSPIYEKTQEGLKLVGVNMAILENNNNTDVKGKGIYMKYLLDLIEHVYNTNAPVVKGKLIPSK